MIRKYLGLFLMTVLLSCQSGSNSITMTTGDEGVLFQENGEDVLFYQSAPKSIDGEYTRADYVHPLYSLDGAVLTEDFPEDHYHQRGIFWTWHQVLIGDQHIGDPWLCQDFAWNVHDMSTQNVKDGAGQLIAQVDWTSPQWVDENGERKIIARETCRITVYPRQENYRAIDFDIALLAVEENVKIGGSDDVKGYGGFSARIRLPEDISFTGPDGKVKPENTAVKAGPWIDMCASFSESGEKSGFAILQHPSNPDFPQQWILRSTGSMQNPVYPGREPVALSTENTTELHYRIILHKGTTERVSIKTLFQDYKSVDVSL